MEVSPNAEPPVCKILDYGRFRYEAQKQKTEARKKPKVIEVKEIKMRPNIATQDYEVKMSPIHRCIEEGDKVTVNMRFRGCETNGRASCRARGWQYGEIKVGT